MRDLLIVTPEGRCLLDWCPCCGHPDVTPILRFRREVLEAQVAAVMEAMETLLLAPYLRKLQRQRLAGSTVPYTFDREALLRDRPEVHRQEEE